MRALAALAAIALLPLTVPAAEVVVPPGSSIQAAIAGAADGDVVRLETGTYDGNVDFLGKAIQVVGVGPTSVLRGTGTGSVVTFTSGEPAGAVLDSVLVTGGVADSGGGILVRNASPTIQRTVLFDNRAAGRGSAVAIEASAARLFNNLVVFNTSAGGDPHSIDVTGASPTIVNNTIVRGDSNGIIIRGASAPLVMNNIIASNGSVTATDRRGRGICDFGAGGAAVIHYNVFNRNRVGALLTDGRDFFAIRGAQRRIGPPRLVGNVDGRPGFAGRIGRNADDAMLAAFALDGRGRATNAGNPDPAYDDVDGTRNDAGFTGGPLAPTWALD
jgi:parallel beta-helix repeat protein